MFFKLGIHISENSCRGNKTRDRMHVLTIFKKFLSKPSEKSLAALGSYNDILLLFAPLRMLSQEV